VGAKYLSPSVLFQLVARFHLFHKSKTNKQTACQHLVSIGNVCWFVGDCGRTICFKMSATIRCGPLCDDVTLLFHKSKTNQNLWCACLYALGQHFFSVYKCVVESGALDISTPWAYGPLDRAPGTVVMTMLKKRISRGVVAFGMLVFVARSRVAQKQPVR
jgi:hypothetical protein